MSFGSSTIRVAATTAFLLGGASIQAMAAPVTINETGIVISAAANWVGDIGSVFNATATFDLDGSAAYAEEFFTPGGGEPNFNRWTFNSATAFNPYGASASGAFGTLTSGTVSVETLDNVNLATFGFPFGLSGIVDILTINFGQFIVDCTGGIDDPVTGCNLVTAPRLYGEEFQVNFIADANWFTGDTVLPTSLTPSGLKVFGNGEQYTQVVAGQPGVLTAVIEIDFNTVPEPATLGLFGLGLAGIGLAARRRQR